MKMQLFWKSKFSCLWSAQPIAHLYKGDWPFPDEMAWNNLRVAYWLESTPSTVWLLGCAVPLARSWTPRVTLSLTYCPRHIPPTGCQSYKDTHTYIHRGRRKHTYTPTKTLAHILTQPFQAHPWAQMYSHDDVRNVQNQLGWLFSDHQLQDGLLIKEYLMENEKEHIFTWIHYLQDFQSECLYGWFKSISILLDIRWCPAWASPSQLWLMYTGKYAS